MATIQKVTVPADTPTVIVNGDGRRVWVQGGTFYLGGSNVDPDNGIFLSGGNEFLDLGNVAITETIYAYSSADTTITVFYYTTVF
ncbi:hypothetical protein ABES25_22585 [Bacillus gobiensis]|uniref:hypothetical protein n=1 Tax=Bacillus gobiensis TaxID=1441095 RepID=UPI003D1C9EF1